MRRNRFPLVTACFVLSGVAGLIYQTAWTQQFALVFGTSELAVATVLAAYMGGLTAGAALAGRYVERVRRPVLAYALLELGIALSALAVPAALRLASRLQVLLLGGLDVPPDAGSLASALFYLGAAFGILLVPTALMGATLPLLARYAVRRDREIGPRVGGLYAANTAGAAAGALLGAFVLLPWLGLGATVWVAVSLNLLVFGLAALLAGREAPPVDAGAAGPLDPRDVPDEGAWILPLVLASGFVSFGWEILWTRLLSHLLGGSIYAFGTMLATFLTGIGLGSAIASRWAGTPERARAGFAVAQLGIGASSWAAFAAVDRLAELAGGGATRGALAPGVPIAAATLLPGALFVGATLPFAVRILARGAARAGRASARVYAWNTLGAIAGAIATGFFLLPALRFAGLATAAVVASFALAWLASLRLGARRRTLAGAALAGLVLVAVLPPRTPWRVLRTAPISGVPWPGEIAFYGTGRSATVLLLADDGEWRLTTNGLPESAIQPRGARESRFAIARWLSLLPIVSRPEARSYLIVGLGAGLTLDAVPATVEEIHVVELEPEVVRANRSLAGARPRDPLADPRLSLHVHDARSALSLSDRRFDAIVSQPSHPWTAGASHLFTREFFALVRERLSPEGVFVQWIGQRFVDELLLRSLLATLLDVFPHVEVFEPPPGGGLLFLAGLAPLDVPAATPRGLEAGGRAWGRLGVLVPEDVLAARILDGEGARQLAAGAPLTTDQRNLFQTRSPKVLRSPLERGEAERLFAGHDPLTRLTAGDPGLYYVRRLLRQRAVARARRVASALEDPAARRVARALVQAAEGRRGEAEEALTRLAAAEEEPGEATYALLLLRRQAAPARFPGQALPAGLDPPSAAVVEGWRLARLQDDAALRRLEEGLAAIGPRHPLFQAATLLRIHWRQASGDPGLAREALELFDARLASVQPGGAALIRRARLAVGAGDPDAALASLNELSRILDRRPNAVQARRGFELLSELPPEGKEFARLREKLAGQLAAEGPVRR